MSKKVNVIAGFEHKGWSKAFCPILRSDKTGRLIARLSHSLTDSAESAAHSAELVAEYNDYHVVDVITDHEI
jgi:hypothetical protein